MAFFRLETEFLQNGASSTGRCNTIKNKYLYQMVLHRPVELAGVIGELRALHERW